MNNVFSALVFCYVGIDLVSPSQQLDRFMSMFDSSSTEGLWLMDEAGRSFFYNDTFYGQFDLPKNPEFKDWINLVHSDDRAIFTDKYDEHLDKKQHGERVQSEYRVLKKDGSYCWIEAIGIMNHDGVDYMVGSHKDVTHEKNMLSRLHNLAFYDHITGLPNGEKFQIDFADPNNEILQTLVVINAESLRSQFNLYGSEFLEKVVQHIVRGFAIFKPYNATCYRTSLDMFLVHIPVFVTEDELEEMFKELLETCESASQVDTRLSGMINLFFGAIQYTKETHSSAEEVVQWASKTCEYAMHHNQEKWAICNASLQSRIERFFYIESQLQKKIESDEITIHLQPIFNAKTKQLSSFEALARWEESEIGSIYPDEFIPTTERKGLISVLGLSVLRQACQFIKAYNQKWQSNVRVNVNVSVLQLFDTTFPDKVIQVVEGLNIKPEWIVLELTESVLLDTNHYAIEQLQRLKEYGFKLAMDDFGTGYTSIMGFFRLPFRQIKLDRELAQEVLNAKKVHAYMEFVIQHCTQNGIEVTVEGIEDERMLDLFTTMGVTFLQGYYFSRPLKIEKVLNFHAWSVK